MNINIFISALLCLLCFFGIVLTYSDYKKALISGNERRINKDKKDLKEAMAIFMISIICFIFGVFVF